MRGRAAACCLMLLLAARAALAAPADWFVFGMDPANLSGAPEVAFLNRPLDASARIVARDGHFFRTGADGRAGERVRFFGVNLSFGANFPDAGEAASLARQLRRLGFNAVRLHHLDSLPSDYPDAPISILTPGPFPSFSQPAVARLRGLIQALAAEGIYVNLNLHVGYRFRPGVDDLPALDGGADMPALTAPIHLYDPRLIAMQEEYARQLIARLGLKDNPALAMVEINNESSLLAAWLGPDWQAAVPSAYAPQLRKRWQAWLLARHGSLAQACAAWGGCPGGDATEFPEPGGQQPDYENGLAQLRAGIARRVHAWLGPGGPAQADPREQDFLRFLAATDQAYFERLRRVVHDSAGAPVPVTGTQMGFGGLMNFDSQPAMDYIDEHFYVAHPDIRSADDWRIPDLNASDNEFARVLALSLRRDRKRPFVVSEFNQPFPNPRGAEILPLMSAMAALQDWDGLFYFDYSDAQRLPQSPSRFALSGDWGRMALAGQSARLFRQPLLQALPERIDIPVGPRQRLLLGADRRFDAITAGLAEGLGVQPQWALQGRVALDLAPAPDAPVRAPDAAPTAVLNRADGHVLIQAPCLWAVFGAAGSAPVGSGPAWMQFDGAGPASAMLTCLDGQPLARSRHLLLSLGNDTTGTQPGSMPQRPKLRIPYWGGAAGYTLEPDPGSAGPSGDYATRPPAWLRRMPATLGLSARAGRLTVYPLDGEGRRRPPLPATDVVQGVDGARVRVQAGASPSPWYELVYEDKP
ncbi:capsular biosynthesis protein [Bordetella hinzii]|nr:capsular biosynthesis protein [Bordetella hinzii]QDJ43983.1 capsular biosynthesis protein [Bordetella hinzii]QWF39446.1 capsular biosynthesis protein [Bordetella hinzii]QWF43993.1 capsular biosynthesis protein [Bordetella hinzii]QWF48529.1 capsular biosynthesis protein [Bordetella hinzii]QWF53066.1 capsular biosynthesis protein [Bordetella hinzii]